ncbi:hypothetical protein L1887_03901 [Cichorium endivia]|nr:hypothetical protein L1887_03901 [Cichorium endivia]
MGKKVVKRGEKRRVFVEFVDHNILDTNEESTLFVTDSFECGQKFPDGTILEFMILCLGLISFQSLASLMAKGDKRMHPSLLVSFTSSTFQASVILSHRVVKKEAIPQSTTKRILRSSKKPKTKVTNPDPKERITFSNQDMFEGLDLADIKTATFELLKGIKDLKKDLQVKVKKALAKSKFAKREKMPLVKE